MVCTAAILQLWERLKRFFLLRLTDGLLLWALPLLDLLEFAEFFLRTA
jgi:hypothetical protein